MAFSIIDVPYPPPASDLTFRKAMDIDTFIIHHSAGPTLQTPLGIDAFERSRGDLMMPYSWLIDIAGNVYKGRPYLAVSAASYGRNAQSVAVCCIGDFQSDDAGFTGPPSDAMLASLVSLRVYAQSILPALCRTIGHRDIAPMFFPQDQGDYSTACPGDLLYAKIPWVKSEVVKQITHG